MDKRYLIIGSVLAMLAVIIGAFGAHALSATLEHTGRSETYNTGVRYQMFHALAIFLVGILMKQTPHVLLKLVNGLFLFGVIIFSGSLYVLSVTDYTLLGAVTPLGGICFIGGWLILIYYLVRVY